MLEEVRHPFSGDSQNSMLGFTPVHSTYMTGLHSPAHVLTCACSKGENLVCILRKMRVVLSGEYGGCKMPVSGIDRWTDGQMHAPLQLFVIILEEK